MRRALVPFTLVAAIALAGCGGTSSTTTSDSPSAESTEMASAGAATASTPSSTPSGTPTSTTTSSPSGSSTTPAVHTYRHLSVSLPVADDAVAAAPPGLTAYLRRLLQRDWKKLGHTRECRTSGVVELRATRADGFAYGTHEINVTPQGGCEKAATMGGGYRAVWKSVDGVWRQVLAMQDVPDCSQFEKWDVPSAILGKDAQCYDGSDVVPYHHA